MTHVDHNNAYWPRQNEGVHFNVVVMKDLVQFMDGMQSHTLSLIFTIAVVASIVLQACVVVSLFIVVRKAVVKLTKVTGQLSEKALPLVSDVRTVVQDLTPKIRKITSQVSDITEAVCEQTQHVNKTVDDVVDRTHAQAVRVDDMVSAVLGSIAHAGATVQSGVARPVRKASGVVHGVRVGLETLFSKPQPVAQASPAYASVSRSRAVVIAEDLDENSAAHSVDQTIHPPPTTSSPL